MLMRRVPRAPCPRFKPQAVPSLKQSTQPCSSEAALLPRSLGAESAPRMRAPLPAPSAPRSLVAKVQAWQRCKNGGPPHRSAAPRGQQPTASRRAPARRARRTARDQPPARGRRSAHLNRGAVVVHELAITAEATPLNEVKARTILLLLDLLLLEPRWLTVTRTLTTASSMFVLAVRPAAAPAELEVAANWPAVGGGAV